MPAVHADTELRRSGTLPDRHPPDPAAFQARRFSFPGIPQMWLAAVWLSGSGFSMRWEDGGFVAAAFVIGAIVGSFLNVVAYRVPAGWSVVSGRSACPACGQPVRARDNISVLGWLLLRGRCRDCGMAIPATYAVVEAGCGLALAALATAEAIAWQATGSSIPLIDRAFVLGDYRWLLGWAAGGAATLTIVAWGLLARAGHVVTRRTALLATALVAALLAVAGWFWPLWGG